MKKSRLAEIEAELMRLQEGNLAVPVKVQGVGVTRAIYKRLETLRLTLLRLRDNELDIERRSNNAVAAVAHDMKTPLAIISGYAECLMDGVGEENYPKLILEKTQQMNDMVLSLIDESHRSIERHESEKSLQSTRIYFGEVMKRLRTMVEDKGLKLKVNKIPNASVRINSHQFGRVMQNLFTNAIKYSPAGTTIKATFRLWAKKLYIHIKDQGEGISKESLPYIFDQFYKEDKTRASGSSHGLGLYIVKEIVRDHGGEIRAHSKKGKGSTFTVVIPVEPTPEEKMTATGKFDRLNVFAKLAVELVFGWLMASMYRLIRFFETRNLSTLIGSFICLWMFPFMWLVDILSIAVYGRIAFLAD